jgi:hypothetical protein
VKQLSRKLLFIAPLGMLLALAFVAPRLSRAQVPWGSPGSTTPSAQRNALSAVQAQVGWLQNATRNAQNYLSGPYEMVWQQFQSLCGAYNALKATLNPRQLASGANELAELDAGLGILQEAFSDYQDDLAAGQSSTSAFRRMCQDLNEAAGVWVQELNKDAGRMHVGWP